MWEIEKKYFLYLIIASIACGCGASAPSSFLIMPMVPPVYRTRTLTSLPTSTPTDES